MAEEGAWERTEQLLHANALPRLKDRATSSKCRGHEEAERAGDRRQPGGVRMLSETALGCHWYRLFSAFTSPGARAGHCRAKRRQHTACPW